MAADTQIKHAGAWRTINGVQVRHSGAWRDVQTIEVKHAGAWRTVYSAETLTLNALSSYGFDFTPAYYAYAGIKVDNDNNVYEMTGNGSWTAQNPTVEWLNQGTTSNYECMLVKSTGVTPSGPTLSTYHTCGTDRIWTLLQTTAGNKAFTGTLYIREIANTSNIVSASVSITVEAGLA